MAATRLTMMTNQLRFMSRKSDQENEDGCRQKNVDVAATYATPCGASSKKEHSGPAPDDLFLVEKECTI
jgi:hypothetical protein